MWIAEDTKILAKDLFKPAMTAIIQGAVSTVQFLRHDGEWAGQN